jgi:hypothetical protein
MHEDDPEHFEVMLKYLYTNRYESPEGTTELARRFLIPIGVHTLADKYDIEGLGMLAVNNFGLNNNNDLSDYELDEEELKAVIEAHYSVCAAVDSALGNCIAEFVLRYYGEFMQRASFQALVAKYPVIAVDILLRSQQLCLLIGKCTRRHK